MKSDCGDGIVFVFSGEHDWVTASHSEPSLISLQENIKATHGKSNFTVVVSKFCAGLCLEAGFVTFY